MKYKWSIFNYNFTYEKVTIIRNMLTESLVKIENENYFEINNNLSNTQVLNNYNKEIVNSLHEQGILVNKNKDEKDIYLKQLEKDYENDDLLSLVIASTYGCNFNCLYCYESGINKKAKFKDEDTQYIVNYIKKYLNSNKKITRVNLTLFGGEPTLNWSFFENLLPKLDILFKEHNIFYTTSITTNGYLFTQEKAIFLKKYSFKSIEVTLDGPSNIHNKRRPLLNNHGTFDKIWKNIEYILNNNILEFINLRINISKDNYIYVEELIQFISSNYPAKRFKISLGLVTDTIEETSAQNKIDKIKLTKYNWPKVYLYLYKILLNYGFEMEEFYSMDGYCLAKEKHSLIICPDENIYRCLSMVGRNNLKVGALNDNKLNNEKYLSKEKLEKCFNKKCPLIPVCMSGCCFESIIKYESLDEIYCRKEEYDIINKGICEALYVK